MGCIQPLIDAKILEAQKRPQQLATLRAKCFEIELLLDQLSILYPNQVKLGVYDFWSELKLIVDLTVDDFSSAAPMMEMLETFSSIEFNQSQDQPASGYRSFMDQKKGWFRLDVHLTHLDDGEKCKRVVTGHEMVPTYEFRCEGSTTPLTPPDDIPF